MTAECGPTDTPSDFDIDAIREKYRVEREKRLIDQRVQKVQAETARLVASIDREVQNTESLTDAEIDKMKSQYASQIAELEAEIKRLLEGKLYDGLSSSRNPSLVVPPMMGSQEFSPPSWIAVRAFFV